MTNGTNGSASPGSTDQFLVAPRNQDGAAVLADFEKALQDHPEASVLSRGGRPDQPRLVVTLRPDSLQQLKSRFGDSLIIERNAPINPL
jgi:hypothetical protein